MIVSDNIVNDETKDNFENCILFYTNLLNIFADN